MALRAAESDEDVWLPAPNRDRKGADVFTGVFNGADVKGTTANRRAPSYQSLRYCDEPPR